MPNTPPPMFMCTFLAMVVRGWQEIRLWVPGVNLVKISIALISFMLDQSTQICDPKNYRTGQFSNRRNQYLFLHETRNEIYGTENISVYFPNQGLLV